MVDLVTLENIPQDRLEAIKNECYVEKNTVDMMTMVLKTVKVLDTKRFAQRVEEEFGIIFPSN